MPSISVRVKTRSVSATGGDRRHNLRIGKQPDHVVSARTAENSVVLKMPTPTAMVAKCLARRKKAFVPGLAPSGKPRRAPQKMAKDAAISVSGIITFSTDAYPTVEKLKPDEQNRRFRAVAEAIAERLGTDLVGLVVHRDETNPHAHFTLYGYGKNGEPVSRKMPKKVLSELQDIAEKPFVDLGITRGKKISERIKDGEPYSKTVNRSVRELHRDLPIELAAAREKVADMQGKVASTQEKLAARERELAAKDEKSEAQDKNLAKLQKRLSTYEKRLANRKAEAARLANLTEIPKPQKRVIEKPQPRKFGVLKPEPQRESLVFYTQKQMREYAGNAKAVLNDEKATNKKLNVEINNKTKGYQHATKRAAMSQKSGLEALGGVLVERYGVMVNETPERVSVPPQKPATDAQIGAALYRASRDAGWEKANFSVNNRVAEKILAMAKADRRLDAISFDKPTQQRVLVNARKAAQDAPKDKTVGNAKTSIEKAHEKRQKPLEGPDFDDGPSGPGMG